MPISLFDSHCHVDMPDFDADRTEVFARAAQAGVGGMVLVASSAVNLSRVVEIARGRAGVRMAAGISPFEAPLYSDVLPAIEEMLAENQLAAVGECGLDFYHDTFPPGVQAAAFSAQIALAAKFGRPLIVHCRDAWDESRALIDAASVRYGSALRGVIHCFTGNADDAQFFARRGFSISFAGNLTYKKADDIRAALRAIPIENVLFETDSPYLAPFPLRGRRCEPAFVLHTVEFAAKFLGIPLDDLARITTGNAVALFGEAEQ
ncbi:MAG: TatD family hydrolase [Candidatus Brocadiia bacterium]